MNIYRSLIATVFLWSIFGALPESPTKAGAWLQGNMAYARGGKGKGGRGKGRRDWPPRHDDDKEDGEDNKRDGDGKGEGHDWAEDRDKPKADIPYPRSIKGFLGQVGGKVVKIIDRNRGIFSFKVSKVHRVWSGNKAKFPYELNSKTIMIACHPDKKRSGNPPLRLHLQFFNTLRPGGWVTLQLKHIGKEQFIINELSVAQQTAAKRGGRGEDREREAMKHRDHKKGEGEDGRADDEPRRKEKHGDDGDMKEKNNDQEDNRREMDEPDQNEGEDDGKIENPRPQNDFDD